MAKSRIHSYTSGTPALGSDIREDFDNILDDAINVISPLTASLAAGGNDITGVDELQFNDATADASASGRIRRNGADLTFHDGTAARTVMLGTSISRVEFIRKTADETVNGSDTLQNDDHLVAALAANEVVAFEMFLIFDAATAADFKMAFTVPASATINWGPAGGVRVDESLVVDRQNVVVGSATTMAWGGYGAGTKAAAMFTGIVVNSTNAGNLQFQWAQNTSNASDAKVYTNSWLRVTRV